MSNTPKEEEKLQCNKCLTIFTGIGDEFCPECNGIMSKIIHTPQNITSKESWVEEFITRFGYIKLKDEPVTGTIINFISSLLTQRDEEWKTELENITINHAGKKPWEAIKAIISKMIK